MIFLAVCVLLIFLIDFVSSDYFDSNTIFISNILIVALNEINFNQHLIDANLCSNEYLLSSCIKTCNSELKLSISESTYQEINYVKCFKIDTSITIQQPKSIMNCLNLYEPLLKLTRLQLFAESMYSSIDECLQFLQSQSIIIFANSSKTKIGFEMDSKKTLLHQLLEILPSHKRPIFEIFNYETSLELASHIKNMVHNIITDDNHKENINLPSYLDKINSNNSITVSSIVNSGNCTFTTYYTINNKNDIIEDVIISKDSYDEVTQEDKQGLRDLTIAHHIKYINNQKSMKQSSSVSRPCIFSIDDEIVLNKIKVLNNSTSTLDKKLLCILYTYSPHHDRVRDIIHTWGRKCNGFIAFSNDTDESINAIGILPSPDWVESYFNLWKKIQFIIRVVSDVLLDEYDYFLFGGDDLFVIVENLKAILNSHYLNILTNQGKKPVFIGREMKWNKFLNFITGGPGYILNRVALIRLHNQLILSPDSCMENAEASSEDVLATHCLYQAGVTPLPRCHLSAILKEIYNVTCTCNSNNEKNEDDSNCMKWYTEELFHHFTPGQEFVYQEWLDKNSIDGIYKTGLECCSPFSVSFHYIHPPLYNMKCFYDKIYNTVE